MAPDHVHREACGLRWVDVDLETEQFTVVQQLVEDNGTAIASAPKSAASRRVLERTTTPAELRHPHISSTRSGPADCHPCDCTTSVRHGAATLALAASVDLRTVQDLLGHTTIVTTADIYASVLPELQRAAARAVAALVLKNSATST